MKFRRAAAKALNDKAEDLLDVTQTEVPVGVGPDAGELMKSGRVEEAEPHNLEAQVVYGGPNIPYAAAQHEGEMDYVRDGQEIHWEVKKYSQPGRKKKYVEDPLKAMMPTFDESVAVEIARELGWD
jgi:hypothetical protein